MFERFGEFDSAAEINETAVNLRREGDKESILVLAKENGIDEEVAEAFIEGDILFLCNDLWAATGKLDIEKKEIDCAEIIEDWMEYIRDMCSEDEEFAKKVRSKKKNLKDCIGEILKWSFKNQHPVDSSLMKAAGVTAGKCTLGIPGMATAKKIIREYYLGK